MVIFPENRPIFGEKIITKFFWPHKSMVIFEKNTTFFAKKGDFWLQISIGISARNRWNSTEKKRRNQWDFCEKLNDFSKKVTFGLAEINGDFCFKSMKFNRKTKKLPAEINGDFCQKLNNFSKKVTFCLAEINGDFCFKSMKSNRKTKKFPAEINGVFCENFDIFSKKRCFLFAEINGDFCLKSMKFNRKTKKSLRKSMWFSMVKTRKIIKIWLLKTGVRLAVRRLLSVLEPDCDFQW